MQRKCTFASLSCQHYQIPIKGFFTCNTVVYLLKGPCGMIYIGQTSRSIKMRFTEHKLNIKRYKQRMDDESLPIVGEHMTKEKKKFGETTLL